MPVGERVADAAEVALRGARRRRRPCRRRRPGRPAGAADPSSRGRGPARSRPPSAAGANDETTRAERSSSRIESLPSHDPDVASPLPTATNRWPCGPTAGPLGAQMPASRVLGTWWTTRSWTPSTRTPTTLPWYGPQSPASPPSATHTRPPVERERGPLLLEPRLRTRRVDPAAPADGAGPGVEGDELVPDRIVQLRGDVDEAGGAVDHRRPRDAERIDVAARQRRARDGGAEGTGPQRPPPAQGVDRVVLGDGDDGGAARTGGDHGLRVDGAVQPDRAQHGQAGHVGGARREAGAGPVAVVRGPARPRRGRGRRPSGDGRTPRVTPRGTPRGRAEPPLVHAASAIAAAASTPARALTGPVSGPGRPLSPRAGGWGAPRILWGTGRY